MKRMPNASGPTTNTPRSGQGHRAEAKPSEWHSISEALQTALAQQAMHQASLIVAEQAEMFAAQFRSGVLQDRGAADALKLFATLLRETSASCLIPAGNA